MREIKFRGRDEHGEWHYGAFMGVFYDGVIARPAVELKNRRGGRVIVKIKARDFA